VTGDLILDPPHRMINFCRLPSMIINGGPAGLAQMPAH
jgi:hypothetical protein